MSCAELLANLKPWLISILRTKKNVIFTILMCVVFLLLHSKTNKRVVIVYNYRNGQAKHHEPMHDEDTKVQHRVAKNKRRSEDEGVEDDTNIVHVPKVLSKFESYYYHADGRPKALPQHELHDKPNESPGNLEEEGKPKPDQHKLPGGDPERANPDTKVAAKDCDYSLLHVNDTRIERNLDPCVFPTISGGPELDRQIDLVQKIELPLLKNYRNPCWYEKLPESNQYKNKMHMFWWQAKASFDRILPVMEDRRGKSHLWRLRCLPLVYVIGMPHCGASDLIDVLLGHPHVIKGATREPYYWDRSRWLVNSSISNYLDLYDEAAEEIRKTHVARSLEGRNVAFHPVVTVDASARYLTDFRGIHRLSENKNQKEPSRFLPHLIRNLTPNTNLQVIVALRNPTERVFVNYADSGVSEESPRKSPEEFHELVSEQVDRLSKCAKRYSLKHCLFDTSVINTKRKVDVYAGVYFGFIKEWIAVFPKIKVIVWDEFRKDRVSTYNDLIREIGLKPDPKSLPAKLAKETDPDPGFKMLDKTKTLLDDFYRPYNQKLSEFLKDQRLLFE